MGLKDREKSKSALLREGLAKSTSSAGACPDPETLAAYYQRSLDAADTQRCEMHLAGCPSCREQTAAMVRADESAIAGARPAGESEWAWLWDWRWLAPAAAVLALAVFWLARKPTPIRTPGPQPQPLVAMSQPTEAPASSLARQSPAIERDLPSALTANKARANAKELSPRARTYAPSSELKKEAVTSGRDENKTVESENGALVHGTAQPAAGSNVPAVPSAPPASQDTNDGSAGGVVGGAVGGAVDGAPAGAAKQQPGPVTSELVSRYSMKDQKVSLQAAYQRSIEIRSPDSQVLWRASGGGLIERSVDGGTTWQAQRPVADARIVTGTALSAKTCWIAGRDGIILLTKDGTNWTTIPPPVHADFVSISARDDSSATVTTADGRKFTTQDAGKKWQPAQ
jgi:Photosynthesis system II assembly factor YCF48/Putative zinc-finger